MKARREFRSGLGAHLATNGCIDGMITPLTNITSTKVDYKLEVVQVNLNLSNTK